MIPATRRLNDQAAGRHRATTGVRPVEVAEVPKWNHCSRKSEEQCRGNNGCPCGDAVRTELKAAGWTVQA